MGADEFRIRRSTVNTFCVAEWNVEMCGMKLKAKGAFCSFSQGDSKPWRHFYPSPPPNSSLFTCAYMCFSLKSFDIWSTCTVYYEYIFFSMIIFIFFVRCRNQKPGSSCRAAQNKATEAPSFYNVYCRKKGSICLWSHVARGTPYRLGRQTRKRSLIYVHSTVHVL